MDIVEKQEDIILNTRLKEFPGQIIEIAESHYRSDRFLRERGGGIFSLDELIQTIDEDLLKFLSEWLDKRAIGVISAKTSDIQSDETSDIQPDETSDIQSDETSGIELDEIINSLIEDIEECDPRLKGILNVVLVSKILENFDYVNRNVNEKLIRDNLYPEAFTSDLSFIWLWALRERKIREQIERERMVREQIEKEEPDV